MVLSPNLDNLIFSSFIGGSGNDALYAVQFAGNGDILISGGTDSNNFPVPANGFDASQNGGVDGFVLKINPTTWSIVNGTFIGTDGVDQTFFIQTDVNHNIYVLGQTTGAMPITAGCYGQNNSGLYVQKFNSNLTNQLWNTTIGTGSGEVDISPTAFLVSDCEQIYLSGWGGGVNHYCGGAPYSCMATFSTTNGLPITADASQPTTDGSDFYLCVLSPNATSLVYGSYFGGGVSAEHVDGGTSRFSKNGFVYQAVCAGCQANDDFPTSPSAYSAINPSSGCNIAVFKLSLSPIYADALVDAPGSICPNQNIALQNLSTGATIFEWDFGDGNTSTDFEPQHAYSNPGDYTIQLVASDAVLCLLGDTISIPITVSPNPQIDIQPTTPVCEGDSTQLSLNTNGNFTWSPSSLLNNPAIVNPCLISDTSVWVYAANTNSCGTAIDSAWVTIWPVNIQVMNDPSICLGESIGLSVSGAASYSWTNNATLDDTTLPLPTATPTTTTTYFFDATTTEGCLYNDSITVSVFNQLPGLTPYPDIHVCYGVPKPVSAETANTYQWLPANVFDDPNIAQPNITLQSDTYISVNMTNGCGTGSASFWAYVENPTVNLNAPLEVCSGDTLLAQATGALTYQWLPSEWVIDTLGNSAWIMPLISGSIQAVGTDAFGCVDTAALAITLLPLPFINLPDSMYFEYPEAANIQPETNINNGQWSPTDFVLCDTCAFTSISPTYPTEYHFTIADQAGCGASDSIKVIPLYPFWVPNTFTPNLDGTNDGFKVVSFFPLPFFHLQIFDRWGALVFETTDPNRGWDGGFNGYYAPQDVYTWQLKFILPTGEQKHRGHVTVLR
jgi:gliding motility-associated-like protein